MVHVSATDKCTLNGISTCFFCCWVQDQIQENFQTESYYFTISLSNNFKMFVLDSLIGYFHNV